jgi:hypothetical protein
MLSRDSRCFQYESFIVAVIMIISAVFIITTITATSTSIIIIIKLSRRFSRQTNSIASRRR